jgi:mannan endo-1,4-beta-mannosidase
MFFLTNYFPMIKFPFHKFSKLLILIFLSIYVSSCTNDESGDTVAPTLMSSTLADNATEVDTATTITLEFTEKVHLATNYAITLNNQSVQATVGPRTIIINPALLPGTDYTLHIPANTILDEAGNGAKEITIHFSTAKATVVEGTIYEAESATLTGDAAKATTYSGYSGTGYVNTNSGNVTFTVNVSETAYYNLFLNYISTAQKINTLYVDGVNAADITFATTTSWSEIKAATLKLTAGTHTISLVKSWGYIQLDYIRLAKDTVGPIAFNIVSSPVSANASTQAVNVYNFLKSSFGNKIISGTMAAHGTNITEATWVHTNTGKWPALTGFDFIDHTNLNQNWVNYSAPFTLGQDWWNNNGLVTISWHWRDPFTKSGSFNTSETTFDVSKVTDTSSAEYKAMIVDIDVIAGYLKQFKDANIPVLWRPLHEAEGGWFWWGAKGAEPFKALWKVMFDRLVNYHGLNNLIWVYTTSASANAATWYPGNDYVDVLGMDIYPGENQHGSQYISFNKVREFTGGKKLITLSECGSVPDPALMMEYGDTWSWFMPWNGDYTESTSHNGAAWWQKFFSYEYVVTRDQMPSLK